MRNLLILLLLLSLTGCAAGEQQPDPPAEPAQPETQMTEPVPEADPIRLLLDGMTAEEKVGQLFLARCPDANGAAEAGAYHLGGYVLFGRDFDGQTPESIRQTIADYQAASSIPMLIAVDEEGGTVCRVSSNSAFRAEKFQSPRELYARGGMELVLSMESEKAYLLSSLGINVNLAPVCDLAMDPADFMYSRSLGQSPEITGTYAVEAGERMQEYGVGSVLKHFPGYGSNVDTHTGIAVDDRPLEQLEGADLIPFRQGIRNGCGAIMVSHNIITALDAENPASLSAPVHDYLRQMGFEGVVITDELSMGAIAEQYGMAEAAVLAVQVGNDLLCTTDYQTQYASVLEAVRQGEIPMEQLDQAVYRILTWKQQIGLIG